MHLRSQTWITVQFSFAELQLDLIKLLTCSNRSFEFCCHHSVVSKKGQRSRRFDSNISDAFSFGTCAHIPIARSLATQQKVRFLTEIPLGYTNTLNLVLTYTKAQSSQCQHQKTNVYVLYTECILCNQTLKQIARVKGSCFKLSAGST